MSKFSVAQVWRDAFLSHTSLLLRHGTCHVAGNSRVHSGISQLKDGMYYVEIQITCQGGVHETSPNVPLLQQEVAMFLVNNRFHVQGWKSKIIIELNSSYHGGTGSDTGTLVCYCAICHLGVCGDTTVNKPMVKAPYGKKTLYSSSILCFLIARKPGHEPELGTQNKASFSIRTTEWQWNA